MRKTSKRGPYVISLIFLALPLIVWSQHVRIFDWSRLYNYQPSAQITGLATATTMSNQAKHLFYVYHPAIESKQTFSSNCTHNEHTIVLGCYVGGHGIYLYDVTDSRLSGVEQVTAAHEMLHAAYDRLSPADRQYVNQLIVKTYAGVTDQRIRNNIDSYRRAGADTTNELHSILGTEVATLPPQLEKYYSRYFNDRAKIIGYSKQYEQAFTARQRIVDADDAKIASLKSRIDGLETSLDQQLKNLNAERGRMKTLLDSKQYDDYNAAVPAFNAKVKAYNQDVVTVRSLIDQHNALVAERNAAVLEENELIKAIDSRPDTVTAQ